jgi:hypothetical protein
MSLLNRLKDLFYWGTVPVEPAKTPAGAYEPYATIIESSLRGIKADDLRHDPVYKAPHYVVRMCNTLVEKIHEAGNSSVTLESLVRVERSAAGHTDYHRRFSLYCSELAEQGAAESVSGTLVAR